MRVFTRRKVFLPLIAAAVALGITAAVALANVTLASHTGEVGATWTKHSSFTNGLLTVATSTGRVRADVASQFSGYWASGAPTNANYKVEADLYQVAASPNGYGGVYGRIDTAANTAYLCSWDSGLAAWKLSKNVAGTSTQLGSTLAETLTTGAANHVVLSMNGTTISCTQDGTTVASVTDSSITAAGKAGLFLRANANVDDTHNLALDNFTATDL